MSSSICAGDREFGTFSREPRQLTARGAHVGEFAIRPHVRVHRHGHEGEVLFLVLEGALAERARIGGTDETELPAGVLRALPAGDRRDLTFGPAGATCLVVELDAALERDSGVRIRRRLVSRDPSLTCIALRLRGHLDAGSSSLLFELDLLELLAQVAREGRHGRVLGAPRWLQHVRAHLEDAVAYPDLDGLASDAGVHPLHLVRAFRDHYGCSMGDVVRRTRLDRAYRRIVDTTEPLVDVAAASGFADQSHMTREIHLAFGAPPARLRRSLLRR
jgi:AraC family transcriptional regulator